MQIDVLVAAFIVVLNGSLYTRCVEVIMIFYWSYLYRIS